MFYLSPVWRFETTDFLHLINTDAPADDTTSWTIMVIASIWFHCPLVDVTPRFTDMYNVVAPLVFLLLLAYCCPHSFRTHDDLPNMYSYLITYDYVHSKFQIKLIFLDCKYSCGLICLV